ncbi:MAG: LpxI family protein [Halanaerobiales bacterium]
MSRIGLIAGKGNLPFLWARSASKHGVEVYAYQLFDSDNKKLEESVDQVKKVDIGQLDQLINTLHEDQISELVMIGKVEKSLLFQGLELDLRMKKMLGGLKDLNDDNVMLGIVNELSEENIKILKQSIYLEELLVGPGVLTEEQPDEQLLSDMKYGFKMAREIGRLDIGQTVIVKNKAVLAVEAIEGTDQAIKRGGKIGGPGVVVAKVSKPQQDFRFDIPTVGDTTLNNLIEVNARALVIEAKRTFLIDKEAFIKKAEENDILVMALSPTCSE